MGRIIPIFYTHGASFSAQQSNILSVIMQFSAVLSYIFSTPTSTEIVFIITLNYYKIYLKNGNTKYLCTTYE